MMLPGRDSNPFLSFVMQKCPNVKMYFLFLFKWWLQLLYGWFSVSRSSFSLGVFRARLPRWSRLTALFEFELPNLPRLARGCLLEFFDKFDEPSRGTLLQHFRPFLRKPHKSGDHVHVRIHAPLLLARRAKVNVLKTYKNIFGFVPDLLNRLCFRWGRWRCWVKRGL